MRRVSYVVLCVIAICGFWSSYDNVLSDNADVEKAAEATACEAKPCAEKHGLTRMERSPFGQSFQYTWANGEVHVKCTRAYWLAGDRRCVRE